MREDTWTTLPITTAVCETCEDMAPESGDLGRDGSTTRRINRRNRAWGQSHAENNAGHQVRVETVSSRISIYLEQTP